GSEEMTMQPLAQTALSRAGLLPDGFPAPEPPAARELSLLGLVEVLLKEPRQLDDLNREESRQAELMPRFLAISLASFTLFGVALALILHFVPAAAYPHSVVPVPAARLTDGSALALILAYDLGLVAATCLCLPAFYFF